MPDLTLTTFNCENLMMRAQFDDSDSRNMRRRLTQLNDPNVAEQIVQSVSILADKDRTLTAQTLAAAGADVCALQEVENYVVLTAFDNVYLRRWTRHGYPHKLLFEGNDTRGIDVGLLSRAKIVAAKSHASATFATLGLTPPTGISAHERVFRRDCVEVDILHRGRLLTLYLCHFKSMHGGRSKTRPVRIGEAMGVRAIIESRFGNDPEAEWIALGDFNDYLEEDGQSSTDHGLGPLVDDGFAVDAAMTSDRDVFDRWSHHYAKEDRYTALDHVFLSGALARRNPNPHVKYTRIGTPRRTTRYEGFRLPGIGWSRPKASDHCPLTVKIQFQGRPASL